MSDLYEYNVKSETQKNNYQFMSETKISKLVTKMAVPSIISMLVLSVYSLSDIYFVSKLGTSASAAVGIVFSVMTLIQAFSFMLGTGAGSLIARYLGAGKLKNTDEIASVTFFSSLLGGIIVLILGQYFKTDLMKLLGATSTILPYAEEFSHYILIASPVMCCAFVLNILLRSQGKPVLSMIGLAVGGILNIILAPILIFYFKMGISGSGLATLISQCVSFIVLLILYLLQKGFAKIKISLFVKNFTTWIISIVVTGSATLLRQGLVMVANVLLNNHARIYGDSALAGITISSRIFLFVVSVMFGLGQGFQTVAGFSFGAKNFGRLKSSFKFTLFLSFIIETCLAVLLFVFSSSIIKVFQSNEEVAKIGSEAVRYFALSLPFLPIAVITNMLFQSTGQNKQGIFLASCRQGIFFIPLIFILTKFFQLKGIEICQPISNFLTALTAIPFLIWYFKKLNLSNSDLDKK